MWGLSFKEIKSLSYANYQKLWLANQYKRTLDLSNLREVITAIINYSGMSIPKKPLNPSEVIPLPLNDKDDITLPIRTEEEAIELFKEIIS